MNRMSASSLSVSGLPKAPSAQGNRVATGDSTGRIGLGMLFCLKNRQNRETRQTEGASEKFFMLVEYTLWQGGDINRVQTSAATLGKMDAGPRRQVGIQIDEQRSAQLRRKARSSKRSGITDTALGRVDGSCGRMERRAPLEENDPARTMGDVKRAVAGAVAGVGVRSSSSPYKTPSGRPKDFAPGLGA